MTYQPDPEKLAWMFEALSQADNLIRLMVVDELKATRLPELITAEENAAAGLRDALGALQMPEAALSALEGDIARAEGECSQWADQLVSESISARIAARAAWQEWDAELTALNAKRDQVLMDITPLRQAHEEARNSLFWATRDREGIELNVSSPDYAYLGHGPDTDAFTWWNTFFAARTLQFASRDDPGTVTNRLYGKALDYLKFLCIRTGFRTTELSERDAENIRRYWDQVYADANKPGPVPSGADVVAAIHAEGIGSATVAREQARLEHTRVEDHRIPGMPKPVPERDYMAVQRLRDIRA